MIAEPTRNHTWLCHGPSLNQPIHTPSNHTTQLSQWRVPGVLQYLAWCNLLIPALLILCMRAIPPPPSDDATRKGDEQQHQEWACRTTIQQRLQSLAATLLPSHCWWEPAIAALLLPALHLGLTYLLAAPGCPRGYVGPGGSMVASGSYQHCTGGAHGYLDRLLFSPHHILQTPPCGAVYETGAFDPEGIVGSLNAAFLFYLGVLAGRILTAPHFAPCPSPWKRPFLWLAGLALPLALLAYALGGSGLIPINKSLWSLSFVLATAAIDLGLLTGVYLLRSDATTIASPCAFVGRNALVVYVGHILLDDYFPFSLQVPAALEGTHGGALLVDVVGTGMWVLVAGFLHWRRVYIKV